MRALMWFRSDLRIQDNTALHHACKEASDGIIAVFAVCPEQWAEHDWGPMKVDFVLRNLRALSERLWGLGIPLRLLRTDSFSQLPLKLLHLAEHHACDALYFNQEYEVNEAERDEAVRAVFREHERSVYAFRDQVILNVSQIRTGTGGFYTVFTPFKRKWYSQIKDQGPPALLPKPRRQDAPGVKPAQIPSFLRSFTGHTRADLWPEGEGPAGKRLREFVSRRIEAYHQQRDFPGTPGTSTLSPYLAAGVLSPRQCLAAALEANNGRVDSGNKGVATWISELIWREFYRHILIGFPRVCRNQPFRTKTNKISWEHDRSRFSAWCEGRTGIPIVDAGMRQLNQTGWMHNRVRMIVAMFLTKDLFIDWRWGERYFMRHLVDGDFASNNGGWQWSASTGTDAAPYFRIFNPFQQGRRYDASGDYVRRFVPELADLPDEALHAPHEHAGLKLDYPPPIVDRTQTRARVIEAFKRL